jgi:hypothetical protein
MQQIPAEERFKFDKSLDMFFQNFCKILIKEISNGPIKKDITSYVDYYGKAYKGFLNYSEFKEIYLVHISQNVPATDADQHLPGKEVKANIHSPTDEGKLRALFGIFDH